MIFYRKGVRKQDKKGQDIMYDLDKKINAAVFPGLQVRNPFPDQLSQPSDCNLLKVSSQTAKASAIFRYHSNFLQLHMFYLERNGLQNDPLPVSSNSREIR